MMSIIMNKVGAIFVAVSDIKKARAWYCSILELEPTYDIISGHLCCIPLDNNGQNIVLDSKIYTKDSYARTPMFHFNTDDIQAAFQFMQDKDVEIISEIEHGHFFSIKDPDGNMLMVCKC
jgi:catechol 2,3-dioxygenase-like lactoylglutathione lyase family enzyme